MVKTLLMMRKNRFKSFLKYVRQQEKPLYRGFSFFYIFLFVIVFFGCAQDQRVSKDEKIALKINDIFNKYLTSETSRDSIERYIQSLPDDSLKTNLFFRITYFHYKNNEEKEFREWNNKSFKISRKNGDTLKLAEAHWDLANFFFRKEIIDSAFFHYHHAHSYYKEQKEDFQAARMMLNIAILQKNIKDYTGSEISTIRALRTFKSFGENRQLYIAYNNLGMIFNGLGEYRKSIEYHDKALEKAYLLEDRYLEVVTLNNMGIVYIKNGQFTLAIDSFKKSLDYPDLAKEDMELFAMIKDNLAYAKFKANPEADLWGEFYESFQIRDSLNHEAGIVVSKLHMAEYLLVRRDSSVATSYLREAFALAKEHKYHRDILASLLLLSESDPQNDSEYLSKYVALSDSLRNQERAIKNKFERIRFETDEFIAKNEYLTEERKWILGGAGSVFTILVLFFVIWRQKVNNKKLSLEKEQQKANEEIYNLLLEQERKIEQEKQKEKDRISKELHDGILGEMYGIRFNLINLNSRNDEAALNTKEVLLNRLQKLEEEIRLVSRDLHNNRKLEEVGFLNLVFQLCQEFRKISAVEIELLSDDEIDWSAVSNPVKMNLYRIIQEALHNIHKYALASKVKVEFKISGRELMLLIVDNGQGFDLSRPQQGIGLKNMKSRIEELKGNFQINSSGNGTEINIKIPIHE